MSSKFFGFAAGTILGAAATFLLLRFGNLAIVRERDSLKIQVATVIDELAWKTAAAKEAHEKNVELSAKLPKPKRDTTSQTPAPAAALAAQNSQLSSALPTSQQLALKMMREAGGEMNIDSKLLKLKTRMHLTAEQENALRDILMREMDPATRGNTKAELEALLSSEQMATLEQMRQDKAQNRSRARAWSSAATGLNHLDATFGLTDEQQDNAFAALFQLEQARQEPRDRSNAAAIPVLKAAVQQKLGAMKTVLTPEQFAIYQRYEEKMFEAQRLRFAEK